MALQSEMTSGIRAVTVAWLRVAGFWLLVFMTIPLLLVLRATRSPKEKAIPILFHRLLVRLLGFKVRVRGDMERRKGEAPILFVSNHSSYLDIPVLGSVIPASFVAKAEVAGWPFIGMMARLQKTAFVERRSIRAASQRDGLREEMESGKSLILFPEGTSSDGMRTLPFKSSLLSIVEKPLQDGTFIAVQPVSVLCTEMGGFPIGRSWRPYYAWFGDMTLVKHVWDVFKIGDFTVDVIFHPAVTVQAFGNRKLLAEYCERIIAKGVDQCVTGRFEDSGLFPLPSVERENKQEKENGVAC
ncbi:MAG: lysophospholipid acyltransferase family protein [Bdellovibrionales bacterium]|jgi:1-acyl-sn-glycerol-3-phosphate acyltransferase